MAYTRTYHAVVPLEPDADPAVMRWLARESFERAAASDCLHIIEDSYTEAVLDAADIPPKTAKQLGRPITDFRWFRFTAQAKVLKAADA